MSDKMFAELVESIKQAGQIRRVPTMSAREGRALDWTKAQKVILPNLKASTETISLRMPAPLLHAIKREANRRDVPLPKPHQSGSRRALRGSQSLSFSKQATAEPSSQKFDTAEAKRNRGLAR